MHNGADINLNREDEMSPLYVPYENENDSTVKFLLSNGTDIDLLYLEDGVRPFFLN